MKKGIEKMIKKLFAAIGLQVHRSRPSCINKDNVYSSPKGIVDAASRKGLSVSDFVEELWNQKGCTERVIQKIDSTGIFSNENLHILEIGPGTGRYLEKILTLCSPASYEIYEKDEDWASYLASEYKIISHTADGISLNQTNDNSIDFLHAHGVFQCIPFVVFLSYLKEIFRVTRKDCLIVFDIISEECMSDKAIEAWIESKLLYPCFLSENFVSSLFVKQGFSLVDKFKNKYGAGESEYLVFRRG